MTDSVLISKVSGSVLLLLLASIGAVAVAAEPVDGDYIRSLAAPGKAVLVVEYYDGESTVVARRGYASAAGFQASSSTGISVDGKTGLRLFGLEPCQGEMVDRRQDFAGSCEDFGRAQLQILLKSPKVILCRAFVSEQGAPNQDVTCFGYYNFPGSLDSIDNFEEQLVSLGALRLVKRADGSPLRSDLAGAERIGRQGFGMWSDPGRTP